MASQRVEANSNSSRLAQMQMRFQMKQQQEREQRRMEMTEETSPVGDNTANKAMGNGKVRQMFDERRRGAGIDRSNPLKPISTGSRATSNPVPAPPEKQATKTTTTRRPMNGNRTTAARTSDEVDNSVMSNGNMQRGQRLNSHNNNNNANTLPKEFSSLSLGASELANNNNNNDRNNNSNQNEAYSRAKSSNSIKLNPVLTKKSPTTIKPRPPARLAGGAQTSPRTVAATAMRTLRASAEKPPSARRTSATVNTPSNRRNVPKMSTTSMGIKPAPRISTPPPGMSSCRFCKRNFNDERLLKHEKVCERMASSKRKIFDASKHRVKGTEAEKYLKKQSSRSIATTATRPSYMSAAAASGLTVPENSALKRSNWRKKHEEFITAIRAAKKVQAHLARGGDIRDLPPPPPSENADYIQCPHCMRRFNQGAAERHIPKCATMLHNKPRASGPIRKK